MADWLKNKPNSADLDANLIAIFDKKAEKDGAVVICRIGDQKLKGTNLDYLRFDAGDTALHLEFGT